MSDMLEIALLKDFNSEEQMIFMNEMNKIRKSKTTAILLALFLGGIGAHHYYMGNIGLGVVYTVFCWTFIPGIIAFIEIFLMSGRVDRYNQQKAQEIAAKIKTVFRTKPEESPAEAS